MYTTEEFVTYEDSRHILVKDLNLFMFCVFIRFASYEQHNAVCVLQFVHLPQIR
jgi:hypothetical protein